LFLFYTFFTLLLGLVPLNSVVKEVVVLGSNDIGSES
jgi:hypothetical protein